MRWLPTVPTAFCSALFWLAASCAGAPARADTAGEFDFYVLALSWSPTYCKHEGPGASRHQCGAGRSHRFIVHGLWPQHERGYPENCPGAPRRIDRAIAVSMEDLMPDHDLVFHEWRKHGTCSGLSPEAYFELTRRAFERIEIPGAYRSLDRQARTSPGAVEEAFRRANPGLTEAAMAVTCERGALEEVRICLTRDLDFRACRQVDSSGCRSGALTVPPPGAR